MCCLLQTTGSLPPWQGSAAQICQDLAWEKLHTGDWKHVSKVHSYCTRHLCLSTHILSIAARAYHHQVYLQVWRDLYSFTCTVAALSALQKPGSIAVNAQKPSNCSQHSGNASSRTVGGISADTQEASTFALHELDMAAMMGGPLFRSEVDQLTSLTQELHQQTAFPSQMPSNKRQKVNHHLNNTGCPGNQGHANTDCPECPGDVPRKGNMVHVTSFVQPQQARSQTQLGAEMLLDTEATALLPPGSLQGQSSVVPSEDIPSLER